MLDRSECMTDGRCPRGSRCNLAVERRETAGRVRYYITMGHAGFNSAANNRDGYSAPRTAFAAIRRYEAAGAQHRARPTLVETVADLTRGLGFETVVIRHSDRDDFRSVAVWSVVDALTAAFEAGRRAI